jgi:His-Xaa-Ser system protein HxsD
MNSDFTQVQYNDLHSTATVSIDKKVVSKSAVLRAGYWFSRDLWFQLREEEDSFVMTVGLLVLAPTLDYPKVRKIEEWLPEIFNVLMDSQLRMEVQAETASIRELIIAKAFAESGVLEDSPPGTFEDPVGLVKTKSKNLVKITTPTST